MNGISYRQFALPEVLKEVGKDLLVQFCAHFQSDLAAKNITLPEPELPDDDYFKSLAKLLKCPALLPESFKETLFDIEDLASAERSQTLKEAVAEAGQGPMIVEGVCHERIALQLWLRDPAVLGEVHSQQNHLISFEGFGPDTHKRDRTPASLPSRATLAELSGRIDLWFKQNHSRDRTARIELHENKPGEYWFVIRHGDTCRWIYNDEEETAQLIHSTPEAEEATVHLAEQDELWITAKTKVERELYRQQFGLYLRGDADYFSQPCALTLEPLRTEGSDALHAAGCPEIRGMGLHQLEVDRAGGRHKTTIETLNDVFGPGKAGTGQTCFIANTDILIRARFVLQCTGSKKCRAFEISPPYLLEMERASDLPAVIRLLSQRGFRNPQPQIPNDLYKAA